MISGPFISGDLSKPHTSIVVVDYRGTTQRNLYRVPVP
jgi:hypothetical protein